jgi:hypothetical protein
MRPNKLLERTRERQSVTSEPLQPRRSAQPLGGFGRRSRRSSGHGDTHDTNLKAVRSAVCLHSHCFRYVSRVRDRNAAQNWHCELRGRRADRVRAIGLDPLQWTDHCHTGRSQLWERAHGDTRRSFGGKWSNCSERRFAAPLSFDVRPQIAEILA